LVDDSSHAKSRGVQGIVQDHPWVFVLVCLVVGLMLGSGLVASGMQASNVQGSGVVAGTVLSALEARRVPRAHLWRWAIGGFITAGVSVIVGAFAADIALAGTWRMNPTGVAA
jgi:hypothetical protein